MLFVFIQNPSICDFFSDTIALAIVGSGYGCCKKKSTHLLMNAFFNGCSNNLSSRTVASQVLSALVSLTSVFGMRTGGTSPLTSPQWYIFGFLRVYLSQSVIYFTLFFICRQFIYTVDSQLHRIFSKFFSYINLFSPLLILYS